MPAVSQIFTHLLTFRPETKHLTTVNIVYTRCVTPCLYIQVLFARILVDTFDQIGTLLNEQLRTKIAVKI